MGLVTAWVMRPKGGMARGHVVLVDVNLTIKEFHIVH